MPHVKFRHADGSLPFAPLRDQHPLAADAPDDGVIEVSPRAVRRVARVAAEAASRFAGEDAAATAMEWMQAPRALFGGLSAMEACLDLRHCLRAVAVHGLELDPDCDDLEVDLLMAPDRDDEERPDASFADSNPLGRDVSRAPRLFVWELAHERGGAGVWAFHATVAHDETEVTRALVARYGTEKAATAIVRQGFDRDVGLARSLVSTALAETLETVGLDPSSPMARGFDVTIEQRIRA